jgi:hypothetical protein
MDNYYDALTAHRIKLDIVYNELADIWGKSKRPKVIKLADENDYTTGYPVIYNREKYYVIALELKKDEVLIHLQNHNTDMFIADEICWYGNHDLKTLVIDEVSKHLGYCLEEITEPKKKKK